MIGFLVTVAIEQVNIINNDDEVYSGQKAYTVGRAKGKADKG